MSWVSSLGRDLGIVEVDIPPRWSDDIEAIVAVLADRYGAGVPGSELSPPADPGALRADLAAAGPALAEVAGELRERFDAGACGVFIPALGVGEHGLDRRRKAVSALAALLGDLTETEPEDHRVLWDVKEAPPDTRRYSKFSQDSAAAHYHSDSTIVPIPERYFLLYTVTAARCGGGHSTLRDGRRVLRRLEQTEAGRRAVRTLRETELPIRIPKAFRRKYGATAADGYSYVPVLADKPLWRWRKDKIEQGLAKHPECATAEVRQALDTVAEVLADKTDEVRIAMPTDAMVIIDNHVAFHGRAAFTDSRRHLLRIRFHEVAETATQSWV